MYVRIKKLEGGRHDKTSGSQNCDGGCVSIYCVETDNIVLCWCLPAVHQGAPLVLSNPGALKVSNGNARAEILAANLQGSSFAIVP
jgi:hypothetical protein